MKKIPFDFKASLKTPNWHKDFINITDEEKINIFLNQQNDRIVKYIQSLKDNKKRDVFLLSLPTIKDRANGFVVALLALQKSDKSTFELISTIGEINFLKTGDKKYLGSKTKQILSEKPLKSYFFRRIVRTLTWSKWWKLPLTIFKPDIIAVGHNEIILQKAKRSKQKIYFYQASAILKEIRKECINYQNPQYFYQLCKEVHQVLIGDFRIKEKYLERFNYLVNTLIKNSLSRDAEILERCYQYQELPKNIWIGAGTAYSFRLLALAVLRNGGKVTSFAHATGSVLLPSYEAMYCGELAVTNNFVDITPKAKDFFYQKYLKKFPIALNQPFRISNIQQNNKFKKYQSNLISKNKRPVIVYPSNGMREITVGAPMANYMAYLKWQLNLTDILDKMDVDLICQPHPEGIFKDKSLVHPLREKYDLPYRSFEDVMEQADIFLVDFIHSTTFGEILVTEKPIVRIGWCDDGGYYGVSKRIKPLLDKRCRNIQATFDKNGLPVIDETELEQVLTQNWQEKVDSSKFRELLVG